MGNSHKLLSKWFQTRRFLWEFPIGSYVKLTSAVVAILVGVLKCWTQFWKRTTQESFQQSLVEIGSVVSEEKIYSHKNLLLRNHWVNCNKTLVEWSLDGPLLNLCLVILTSNQDGHQAKNRKKGDEILKESSPLKLLSRHLGWRAEPPDIFLEENHPMTISSTFSSYWANGFRQEDFYGNFP
jgi:hypothetical protein